MKAAIKKRKTNKTGSYQGIAYDSLEELAILQWLLELKKAGYVKYIKRAASLLLSDALINSYVKQLKTKSANGIQTLLQPHSFTAEFEVVWDLKKARESLVWCLGDPERCDRPLVGHKTSDTECITYIEVKPGFDKFNSERMFVINRKWVWQKFNIFICLLKVKDLFSQTFTPLNYFITPSGKRRAVKWRAKTIEDFIKSKYTKK